MINHRDLQLVFRPLDGVRVCALACQKQRTQTADVIAFQQLTLWIFFLDDAKCGGCVKKRLHLMLFNDPPENPGIRRAHRLALKHHGRVAIQQRPINNIGMPYDPADIGSRPVHFTGFRAIDILHRPLQRYHVAAVIAHHALWCAGSA